jgi:hypothetical protein
MSQNPTPVKRSHDSIVEVHLQNQNLVSKAVMADLRTKEQMYPQARIAGSNPIPTN